MRLAVVAFAAGVLFLQMQERLPSCVWSCVVIGLMCVVLPWLFCNTEGLRRPGWRIGFSLLALLGFALLGFSWAGWRAQERLSEFLPAEWEGRDVVFTGVVAALPQRFAQGDRYEFDVESVQTPGARIPKRIQLAWYRGRNLSSGAGEEAAIAASADASGVAEGDVLRPGERWRFTARFRQPHGNANPQGFDYEAWLLERNIRALGTVRKHGENVRIDASVPASISAFMLYSGYAVERLRDVLRERFLAALPDAPYRGALIALAIGDQRSIPGEQWTLFNRTGVTHLVSISGLHVTMLAALFAGLANWLWRRSERLMLRLPAPKAALAVGWLAAFVYSLLAGFGVPVQRTLYMLSVAALALWSGRNFGASRILLLALFVVLLIDPWAVLSVGFWLSFGAVAALLFAGGARLGEDSGWRTVAARWGMAQWAVTVACLPLLLLFFQQFSLVSPLANALAIPVVSLLVTPLALIFAVFPWPPLLQLDHWLLTQLMTALAWLAAWPVWQQPAPPAWTVVPALAGIVWLLLPRGFPARWLGCVLLLPVLLWQAPRPPAGEAWVDVLDVGQGLAVVVRTATHDLLYDTGPRYSAEADAGQRVVAPFLRAVGIRRLDTLIASHQDTDHTGGLASVRMALPVSRLLSSAVDAFGGELCVAGQRWTWDGVRFSVLHPVNEDYVDNPASSNHLSCVLKVETAGSSVLLTGDIETKAEDALLLRAGKVLRSDVVIAPHHGSRNSSTPTFLAAVGAREAVFSAGYRNAFGHPHAETLARYAGSRQWRTDMDGAVHLKLSSHTEVSSWRETRRRYWHWRASRTADHAPGAP